MAKRKVLVVAKHSEIGHSIKRIIHEHLGENTKIEFVHSSNARTLKGLVTLIQQNKNIGIVCVLRLEEISSAINEVEKIGLPFGVIEKNSETQKLGIMFLNAL